MMPKILATEKYCADNFVLSYVQKSDSDDRCYWINKEHSVSLRGAFRSLKNVFLPQGFPDTVSKDYLEYQLWDTLQAFCSSLTGSLATHAVLKGVGVGDENATVLAATLTWLLKDGTGMIGRIWFAWWIGSNLDCDCKRWRLFADILNDLAILLEITASHLTVFFTPTVCIAGVFKSVVGVAGGATRAALTQHQALRNNMADVSAKDGSQETLVNLAGLLCNLMLLPIVSGNTTLMWFMFIVFTILHLFANYCAVKAVTMSTFNQTRLALVVQDYLNHGCLQNVMSVKEANLREPVIIGYRQLLRIRLGHSIQPLMNSCADFQVLMSIYLKKKYLVYLDNGTIYIVLHKDSTSLDQLEACFQAQVMQWAYLKGTESNIRQPMNAYLINLIICSSQLEDPCHFLSECQRFTAAMFTTFLEDATRNDQWKIEPVLLNADEWRAEWLPQQLTQTGDKYE